MHTSICRLSSVVLTVVALTIIGCSHQGMPQTSHSVVDIHGIKCEEMRTLVDNGRNRDFAYSYKCDPPMATGYMTGVGYAPPGPPITSAQAALYYARATSNPPAQVCQMMQYKENGQPTLALPACVDESGVEYTETKPLPRTNMRNRSSK